eukprot:4963563-Amphidinium_carterae.1
MVSKDGSEWKPTRGVDYYSEFRSKLDSLQKKYREPDTSLFVNHELMYYQIIRQWEAYARHNSFYDGEFGISIPGRMERFNQPSQHDCNDTTCGVETAFARYTTFQLHGAIDVVENWADHSSYMEASIERLEIWNRPRKTDNIEMSSTYVGRTPFTFVRPASPTRKNEELSNSQESETKRRRVDDILSLLDPVPNKDLLDVPMETSSGEVLASRGRQSEGQTIPPPCDVRDPQERVRRQGLS